MSRRRNDGGEAKRRKWFGAWTRRDIERARRHFESLTAEDLKAIDEGRYGKRVI